MDFFDHGIGVLNRNEILRVVRPVLKKRHKLREDSFEIGTIRDGDQRIIEN